MGRRDNDDGSQPLDVEREDGGYYDPGPRRDEHRGSTARDPRMSKLLAWFYGALGMAFVTGSWIAANNLYQLNVTVARGIDSDAQRDTRINDHELRLRQVERDLNTVEGKVFRGVAGYEQEEKQRGR
jgi:hypothetical protein